MIEYHGVQLDPATLIATEEPDEIRMALSLFGEGDRVIVAGTGMGLLQAVIHSRVCQCVGYEGNGILADLVKANVLVDRKYMKIYHAALSSEDTVQRYIIEPYWGVSRLSGNGIFTVRTYDINERVSWLQTNGLALDVEGTEYDLIEHLDFTPLNKLLIEFHLERTDEAHHNEAWQRIIDAGFWCREQVRVDNRIIASFAKLDTD